MGTYIVDRVENHILAYFLPVDAEGTAFSLPVDRLPVQVKQGDTVELEIANGDVTSARIVERYRVPRKKRRPES
ncbi:hypothetical protein CR205_12195 [Alteribacter lacisalsi]|uniref:DUF3006 domain-containing protein n=1 Tax=Alteribacter lacisalsi TaxID=2045244 RepID=A0A2W0H3R8_9BACI|nr:hypothetical protein [Alteribacter lacisalsi]PYZ96474.1 hypothetical protein CR205_12195 [Alteribacter lacisalsi]